MNKEISSKDQKDYNEEEKNVGGSCHHLNKRIDEIHCYYAPLWPQCGNRLWRIPLKGKKHGFCPKVVCLHPPCSLDLTQCDCWLFPKAKITKTFRIHSRHWDSHNNTAQDAPVKRTLTTALQSSKHREVNVSEVW